MLEIGWLSEQKWVLLQRSKMGRYIATLFSIGYSLNHIKNLDQTLADLSPVKEI